MPRTLRNHGLQGLSMKQGPHASKLKKCLPFEGVMQCKTTERDSSRDSVEIVLKGWRVISLVKLWSSSVFANTSLQCCKGEIPP